MAKCLSARRGKRRIARQHQSGVIARWADEFGVRLDAGNAKARHSRLPCSKDVSFSTQFEVLLGDAKAVLGFAHNGKARPCALAQRGLVEQEAGRGLGPATD